MVKSSFFPYSGLLQNSLNNLKQLLSESNRKLFYTNQLVHLYKEKMCRKLKTDLYGFDL